MTRQEVKSRKLYFNLLRMNCARQGQGYKLGPVQWQMWIISYETTIVVNALLALSQ